MTDAEMEKDYAERQMRQPTDAELQRDFEERYRKLTARKKMEDDLVQGVKVHYETAEIKAIPVAPGISVNPLVERLIESAVKVLTTNYLEDNAPLVQSASKFLQSLFEHYTIEEHTITVQGTEITDPDLIKALEAVEKKYGHKP